MNIDLIRPISDGALVPMLSYATQGLSVSIQRHCATKQTETSSKLRSAKAQAPIKLTASRIRRKLNFTFGEQRNFQLAHLPFWENHKYLAEAVVLHCYRPITQQRGHLETTNSITNTPSTARTVLSRLDLVGRPFPTRCSCQRRIYGQRHVHSQILVSLQRY